MSTGEELHGHGGCQCTDERDTLASLVERSCLTSNGQENGVMLTAAGPCVPSSYGSGGCLRHDFMHDPKCQMTSSGGNNYSDYCVRPWCYVDAKSCMQSSERVYRSNFFPSELGVDLFYSYTTCGSSEYEWITYQQKHALGGIPMVASTGGYTAYTYKRNATGDILRSTGSEYYDNSESFEGVLVEYMNALQRTSDGDLNVTYTYGSKASRLEHPTSDYTAAIQDINDGLVDMSVGLFWVTGERLKLVSFTTPIKYDRTVLVIPRPGINHSLSAQTQKVLDPFTNGVWCLILTLIAVTALLSVWFSDQAWNRRGRQLSQARKIGRPRSSVYARRALDELLQKGIFFNSAGVDQDPGASLPQKLMMFGFSFFILIVVSAYVANLAAFLTHDIPDYVGTVEGVVEKGMAICAHHVLKDELEIAWPTANFVFENSGKEFHGLLDEYNAGNCDVLAVGRVDTVGDIELMNKFCDRDLVFTDSLFVENPIAFPIRPLLASGLSYWMYQGEKQYGITFEASKEEYDRIHKNQPNCNLDFTAQGNEVNEYTPINAENLFFPAILFVVCVGLAIVLQLFHQWALKKGNSSLMLVGRPSSLVCSMKAMTPASASYRWQGDYSAQIAQTTDSVTTIERGSVLSGDKVQLNNSDDNHNEETVEKRTQFSDLGSRESDLSQLLASH